MCIHELSECAYCPSAATFAARANEVRALMARPVATSTRPAQVAARMVPVPSTGDFTNYATGFRSTELTYTRQVPTIDHPHWAVTTETPLPKYEHMVKHYERDIYGEVTYKGLVERK